MTTKLKDEIFEAQVENENAKTMITVLTSYMETESKYLNKDIIRTSLEMIRLISNKIDGTRIILDEFQEII